MKTYAMLLILNTAMFLLNATTLFAVCSAPVQLPGYSVLIGIVAGACTMNFVVAVAMAFGYGYFKRTWK